MTGAPAFAASFALPQSQGKEIRESAGEGTGLAETFKGRGAAFGDLFNDGKFDVVINAIDHHAVLLRNVSDDGHRWVEMRLVGGIQKPA